MPLRKRCSIDAFNYNVNLHKKKGDPPSKQDIAIAYSVLRKACGIESKKKMTPSEMIRRNKIKKVSETLEILFKKVTEKD